MKIDPYLGSMTFKKKDNVWQIIYAHETAAAPRDHKITLIKKMEKPLSILRAAYCINE
jgi:hypothetical protein